LGIEADILSSSVHDPDLERWWQAYLAYVPTFDNARVTPEINLSIPLSGYRVVAQYDAVVVRDQRKAEGDDTGEVVTPVEPSLLIIDWKTYRKRPSRDWLAGRLQTRVYPLILVQAGAASLIDHAQVAPGNVKMCYWLAEYPDTQVVFVYDTATYRADLEFLSSLITEVDERIKSGGHEIGISSAFATDNIWPLTDELGRCRFCNYRSLCGRGSVAGSAVDNVEGGDPVQLTTDENRLDFDLDWGQVQEIAY
jgi:hypothetical protein